jgi:hypothetical protein
MVNSTASGGPYPFIPDREMGRPAFFCRIAINSRHKLYNIYVERNRKGRAQALTKRKLNNKNAVKRNSYMEINNS